MSETVKRKLSLDMELDKLTVFSKPSCVQCTATYRALESKGIDYDIVDISDEEDFLNELRASGNMQAPFVMTPDNENWTGFRPDKITAHALAMA